MEEKNLPLVSVTVITYRSADTVVETLDSIYNQTYPNIELIVSDDCSPDNTVELVRDWLETHKDRFARVELLTVEKNTGVSGNLNRAEESCVGEWMKTIAGDDILLPNCIQDCMDYVTEHPEVYCLFGKMDVFDGEPTHAQEIREAFSQRIEDMAKMSPDELYQTILHGATPPAPASFCKVGLLPSYGISNDERIPMMEDWPRWLNMLKAGIRIGFIPKELVRYRLGGISTSSTWTSEGAYRSKRLFYFYYQHEDFIKEKGDQAIVEAVDEECEIYRELLKTKQELTALRKHWLVRIIRKVRKICKMKAL